MENKNNVEYRGLSLRREYVENDRLPKIKIFCKKDSEGDALQISYGIEEEGLPYEILNAEFPMREALDSTLTRGLGVAVGVVSQEASVYCRAFKEKKAFMTYQSPTDQMLRIAGKNSARFVKHKPFILREDD